MPFLKSKPEYHDCDTPNPDNLRYGTRWQCPECGKIWVVIYCEELVGKKGWLKEIQFEFYKLSEEYKKVF